jgi:mono/diheme cytochrome c family protein
LYIPEVNDEDSKDHNLSLVIGNQATGRWMKRSPFENPYYLANQVGSWLHNWKEPAPNQESYAHAPELRDMSRGERLFRTRCSACHVIGRADEVPPHQSGRLLGPDLLNVTERRDPEWLARWLREPDRMLAEEDPLAMELYAKHGRVSMPNMALGEDDVHALLEFLEIESRRVEASTRHRATKAGAEPAQGATTSCCQKKTSVVLSAADEPPVAGASEGDTRDAHAPRVSVGVVLWSAGLGSFFFSLAALTRRRPAGLAPRTNEPDSVPAPRREAPLSCRVEVNP